MLGGRTCRGGGRWCSLRGVERGEKRRREGVVRGELLCVCVRKCLRLDAFYTIEYYTGNMDRILLYSCGVRMCSFECCLYGTFTMHTFPCSPLDYLGRTCLPSPIYPLPSPPKLIHAVSAHLFKHPRPPIYYTYIHPLQHTRQPQHNLVRQNPPPFLIYTSKGRSADAHPPRLSVFPLA